MSMSQVFFKIQLIGLTHNTNLFYFTDLSTGEIIGIAVAAATVLLVAVIAAYYLCIKEDKKKKFDSEAHPNAAYKGDNEDSDDDD